MIVRVRGILEMLESPEDLALLLRRERDARARLRGLRLARLAATPLGHLDAPVALAPLAAAPPGPAVEALAPAEPEPPAPAARWGVVADPAP